MSKLQLADISKKLGYSKTLISMVLNGKGNQYGISKKTQATVLDAIARLNYAPDKFAKSLRAGKSYFVGLIVGDMLNPFYSKIAHSIENELAEQGYSLMVCSTGENEEKEKLLVEMMVSQIGVDGLIVASSFRNPSFYDHLRFRNLPLLFIDRTLPMISANHVVTDNYGGSLALVNHLITTGCRKIACMAVTPLHLSTIEDRLNAYRTALQKAGIEENEDLIRPVSLDTLDEDIALNLDYFIENKIKPDAFYLLNNAIASSLLKLLDKKEYARFAKCRLACFDDLDMFNMINRKISSVKQPINELGKTASSLILDIISGRQEGVSNKILATELIIR